MPLLLLTGLALVLRAWQAERLSVEHFDEGVYAANLFCGAPRFEYPFRELYAPPLLPALYEWMLIFTGAFPLAVMSVNVVLGTLLVPAVWWTTHVLLEPDLETRPPAARRTAAPASTSAPRADSVWNDVAALLAAINVACNELLIQYSRAALTDIGLTLWLTLGVGAGVSWVRTGSRAWLVCAALAAALAWWTKYNGWLTLAIVVSGAGGWCLCSVPGRRSTTTAAGRSLLLLVVAGLLWLPCLSGLQPTGGYAAVAANHRGYLTGLSGWFSSAARHVAIDQYYTGRLSVAGMSLGLLAVPLFSAWSEPVLNPRRRYRLAVLWGVFTAGFLLATFWLGMLPGLGLLSLCALAAWPSAERPGLFSARPLGAWALAAWLIGLGISTPFYAPYPRLILPLLVGAIIGGACGTITLFKFTLFKLMMEKGIDAEPAPAPDRQAFSQAARHSIQPILPVVAAGVALMLSGQLDHRPGWQDRRVKSGLAKAVVERIRQDLGDRSRRDSAEVDAIVFVAGDPALFDHLSATPQAGLKLAVVPAADLSGLSSAEESGRPPIYGVAAPAVTDSPNSARLIAALPQQSSDLVLLDQFPPAALKSHRESEVRLWGNSRGGDSVTSQRSAILTKPGNGKR
jgi:hypothetical protein